jgi:uncharacterized membrane protein
MSRTSNKYVARYFGYNKVLALIIIVILASASCLSLSGNGVHGLTSLLWLIIIFPILGYSSARILLKTKKTQLAEVIAYSAGLLIALLLALGILLNILGSISHHATLVPRFVVPSFDLIFCAILAYTAKQKYGLFSIRPNRTLIGPAAKASVPIIFPLLSLLGVTQLNNGGSSFFAITTLCAIILYEIFFFAKQEKSEAQYLINIFCVSLALVLSFSMRSNHIIGFDINQEYQVFSAVVKNGIWHPHLFRSTYNACLSITILPTVVKSLVQLSNEYVFKFAMQFILCIVPIVVFSIANKWLQSPKSAFLASLFFIFQNQFIVEFPALIRQQSGMLFFGLIFIVASSSVLSSRTKRFLTLLFGSGLVVSHYSTAYICLMFFLIVILLKPVLVKLIHLSSKTAKNKIGNVSWSISPVMILVLLLFAFCWYGQILESTGNVVQNVSQSITHFDSFFASDSRSSFVADNLHLGSATYNTTTLDSLGETRKVQDSFPAKVYKNTPVLPTSPTGPDLNSSLRVFGNNLIYVVIPGIVKLLAVLGSIVVVVQVLRKRRVVEEGLFILSSGVLFVALIILPGISVDYNLERLYQQLLIVISSVFVIGISCLWGRHKKVGQVTCLVILLLYFLCTSNLGSQLFFNFSDVNLINGGNNYERSYVKDGEVSSLIWLQNNYKSGGINIDRYGTIRAEAYTNLPSQNLIAGLLPSEISMHGYVYATDANINDNLVFDYFSFSIA